jgi:methylenetetrahydrofolate reductase (NADPH)
VDRFERFIEQARGMGLTEKVSILAGITPLKSLSMARYMATKVAGMDIPEDLLKRLAGVPAKKQADEGVKIAVETINKVKEMDGVAGVHIMAIEWEEKVPEILSTAGLQKRPAV